MLRTVSPGRVARVVIVMVVAMAGCVRSGAKRCGEITCPTGRACAAGRCVDPSIVTACAKLRESDACTLPEIGVGTCQAGICIVGSCGDGAINAIDECDGKQLGGKTCLDFGSVYPEGLKCAADCSFDKSSCNGFCGDGIRQSNEECDGELFNKKTCITQGFYAGKLHCTADCKVNLGDCAGRCGDGKRNAFSEQCDGDDLGDATENTCAARGFHGAAVQPLHCTPVCALDAASCACGGMMCKRNTQQCVLQDGIPTCVPYSVTATRRHGRGAS